MRRICGSVVSIRDPMTLALLIALVIWVAMPFGFGRWLMAIGAEPAEIKLAEKAGQLEMARGELEDTKEFLSDVKRNAPPDVSSVIATFETRKRIDDANNAVARASSEMLRVIAGLEAFTTRRAPFPYENGDFATPDVTALEREQLKVKNALDLLLADDGWVTDRVKTLRDDLVAAVDMHLDNTDVRKVHENLDTLRKRERVLNENWAAIKMILEKPRENTVAVVVEWYPPTPGRPETAQPNEPITMIRYLALRKKPSIGSVRSFAIWSMNSSPG